MSTITTVELTTGDRIDITEELGEYSRELHSDAWWTPPSYSLTFRVGQGAAWGDRPHTVRYVEDFVRGLRTSMVRHSFAANERMRNEEQAWLTATEDQR